MMSFLNEIRDLKKKHIWSAKIMDKLLYHTSIYDKLEGGTDRGNLEYDSGEIKPGRNSPEQGNDIYKLASIYLIRLINVGMC